MVRRSRLLTAPLVLIALIAAAVIGIQFKKHQPQKPEVTLAVADLPAFALVHIAQAKKLFEKEGLSVTYKHFPLGRDALNAVLRDEADLATTFDTPLILQLLAGNDLGFLCSLHNSKMNTGIVARGDRGIRRPRDLRGKRIGVTKGISAEYFLHLFLVTNGLEPSELDIVESAPDNAVPDLQSRIDAVVLWAPLLQEISKHLPVPPTYLYSDIYTEISVLAGRRDYLRQRGDVAERVVKALLKAQELLETDEKTARNVLGEKFRGSDPEAMRQAWSKLHPTVEITTTMVVAMNYQARWFRENQHPEAEPVDIASKAVTEYLFRIQPDRVTIPVSGQNGASQ